MSINSKLATLSVGERTYFETTVKDYPIVQRTITCTARKPRSMVDMRFTSRVGTFIPSNKLGEVRYLVCAERTA